MNFSALSEYSNNEKSCFMLYGDYCCIAKVDRMHVLRGWVTWATDTMSEWVQPVMQCWHLEPFLNRGHSPCQGQRHHHLTLHIPQNSHLQGMDDILISKYRILLNKHACLNKCAPDF